MDLLKAELARQKKKLQKQQAAAKAAGGEQDEHTSSSKRNKYRRIGDVQRLRNAKGRTSPPPPPPPPPSATAESAAATVADAKASPKAAATTTTTSHKESTVERQAKADKADVAAAAVEQESGKKQQHVLGDSTKTVEREAQQQQQPPPEQLTRMLRDMGLPIRLFGEQEEEERWKRWQTAKQRLKMELAGRTELDEFRNVGTLRNPFLEGRRRRRRQRGEDDDDDENDEEEHYDDDDDDDLVVKDSKRQRKSHNASTDADNNKGGDDENRRAKKSQDEAHRKQLRQQWLEQEESEDPYVCVAAFFRNVLYDWEEALSQRPDAIRKSPAGKNEVKTMKQCREYIRPLLELCDEAGEGGQNGDAAMHLAGILPHLHKIVRHCRNREFVKAHDAYIDVAIGRAAWPIGVTMVGIHARSGRAKIESDKVAHVMNSELSRKYLTSVKRLLTYRQNQVKHVVAPSKTVT